MRLSFFHSAPALQARTQGRDGLPRLVQHMSFGRRSSDPGTRLESNAASQEPTTTTGGVRTKRDMARSAVDVPQSQSPMYARDFR